jgi:hypothetical protein
MNYRKADRYNETHFDDADFFGELIAFEITELTLAFQQAHGLTVDGMLGPKTRKAIAEQRAAYTPRSGFGDLESLYVSSADWLVGRGVHLRPSHPSWYYAHLTSPTPKAIVWHYTATGPDTAENMAERRATARAKDDPESSWHITIDEDGRIWQMLPLTAGGWHAGGKLSIPILGVGAANHFAVGIELVSLNGEDYTPAQVEAAARVARAIVNAYPMPKHLASVGHRDIHATKNDPGDEWMLDHLPRVIEFAYGGAE